jgi:hypothetical protein
MARMTTARTLNTAFIRTHPAQTVLTALGLSGVVLVFLPFEGGTVPVTYFLEGLAARDLSMTALVGPCVVLPFFISAGSLRWLLTGRFSRWESGLDYALSLITVVLFALFVIITWWERGLDEEVLSFAFPAVGLGAGAWFVIQNLRHGAPPTLTSLVALQLAYVPLALYWLGLPIDALIAGRVWGIRIGAYLAFLTVLVYTAQPALSVRGQPRLPLRLLPLGVVWASAAAWWTTGFPIW